MDNSINNELQRSLLEQEEYDYLKDLNENPIEHCSPLELFLETQLYEHTVEFIGRVDYFEGPTTVNTRYGPKQVLRVILTNEPQEKDVPRWEIQLSIFQENFSTLLPYIVKNHILHIDGAFSTTRGPNINDIRVNFDLTAHLNTVINTVGIYKPLIHIDKPIEVSIPNLLIYAGKIVEIKGFLKMKFDIISQFNQKLLGCITDMTYKIDIHCADSSILEIELGQELKIIGRVKADFPPFIEVENAADIIILDTNKKTEKEMRYGNKIPKNNDDNSPLPKKSKLQ